MKTVTKHALVAATLLASSAAAAQAATISFGPTFSFADGPNIQFNNLVAPTTAFTDATLTFSVRADLNASSENVNVNLDGLGLGVVFDNNPANDQFDIPGDSGTQHTVEHTGTATIERSVFANLVSDGFLNLSFNFSDNVDYGPFSRGRGPSVFSLSGTIEYGSDFDGAPAPVPLPAAGGLMAFGLAGLVALRRRKSAK